MKAKNYDKKREELKREKREGMKQAFEDTNSRKKFVEGIKRSFRSLKRSERQAVKNKINKEINNHRFDLL